MGEFVVGSVVQLKSGGPKMTIQKISGSAFECIWFSSDEEPHKGLFYPETLVIG